MNVLAARSFPDYMPRRANSAYNPKDIRPRGTRKYAIFAMGQKRAPLLNSYRTPNVVVRRKYVIFALIYALLSSRPQK